MNRSISDKVEFIIHKIIVGITFWIISSVVISYQQYIIKQMGSAFLNLLLYLIPILIVVWFTLVNRKKNQWKPFGDNSDMIGIMIIVIISAILLLTIGTLKVII